MELYWSLLRFHLHGTVASAFPEKIASVDGAEPNIIIKCVKAIFSEGFTETMGTEIYFQ